MHVATLPCEILMLVSEYFAGATLPLSLKTAHNHPVSAYFVPCLLNLTRKFSKADKPAR